jgi:hypothetical protein
MVVSRLGFVVHAMVAGALLLLAQSAHADPEMVHIQVFIAHASPSGNEVDPECSRLKKRLGPMKVGSLHKVGNQAFDLRFGEAGDMSLPTGAKLRIVPLSIIRERLHLRVQVPGMVNTRLEMTSGSPVIVGGPKHRGGNLILQIIPEY